MIGQLRAYTAFKVWFLPFTPGTSQPLQVQLWGHRVTPASEGTCTHLHTFIQNICIYNFK